jgi:integrase
MKSALARSNGLDQNGTYGRAKLPEQLRPKKTLKFLNAAPSPRDKAFIFVLYESGCRISELFALRVRNIQFDENEAILNLDGKTGQRRVGVIHYTFIHIHSTELASHHPQS